MIEINIARDFSTQTGFRTYEDGPYSGQEFYEKILKDKFLEALKKKEKLRIFLDGGEGYTSSFLNEAFRRLVAEHSPNTIWDNVIIISNEVPKYIKKIKETIYEN